MVCDVKWSGMVRNVKCVWNGVMLNVVQCGMVCGDKCGVASNGVKGSGGV